MTLWHCCSAHIRNCLGQNVHFPHYISCVPHRRTILGSGEKLKTILVQDLCHVETALWERDSGKIKSTQHR